MGKRRREIDVKLLLTAIQKTCAFENLLFLRFGGNVLEEESRNPFLEETNPFLEKKQRASLTSEKGMIINKFDRIITQAFDPFLYIYIDSQDKWVNVVRCNQLSPKISEPSIKIPSFFPVQKLGGIDREVCGRLTYKRIPYPARTRSVWDSPLKLCRSVRFLHWITKTERLRSSISWFTHSVPITPKDATLNKEEPQPPFTWMRRPVVSLD